MQNSCCIKYYSRFSCKTCFLNLSNGSAHRSWGISSNGRAPASHAGGKLAFTGRLNVNVYESTNYCFLCSLNFIRLLRVVITPSVTSESTDR